MSRTLDLSQMEVRDSYARLLNHLPGAVYRSEILEKKENFTRDYQSRLKFASLGMYKLLGITPEEMRYGVDMLDSMILPEDLAEAREKIYTSYLEKKPYQMMYRMRLKNGEVKWIWDQGEVVEGELPQTEVLDGESSGVASKAEGAEGWLAQAGMADSAAESEMADGGLAQGEAARAGAVTQAKAEAPPHCELYGIEAATKGESGRMDMTPQGELVKTSEPPQSEAGGFLFIEGIMMDFSEHKSIELALKEENLRLQTSQGNIYGFGEMVGASEPMRALYAQIEKAARSDSNVLILGETGTGKELCARTIHQLSERKGAFVPVNCGAIPEQLMESEFFGHVKGAFTGAVSNRDGFVKAAHNGTLFLDEIGELPLHLQVKLLRTLESKQFTPVGSTTPQKSSFRLITATHQDLGRMVKEKLMRSDFYYRINVLALNVPPLREREGDIPLLIAAYTRDNGIAENVPLPVRIAMEHHSWPGNIREMRNFLERFFMFGESALEDLEENYADFSLPEGEVPLEEAMKSFEYKMIMQALEKCRWRQVPAARLLGLNLRTFQRKLKAHNIAR